MDEPGYRMRIARKAKPLVLPCRSFRALPPSTSGYPLAWERRAVYEGMIADDDLHQRRGLGMVGRVQRLVVEYQEGPVYGVL